MKNEDIIKLIKAETKGKVKGLKCTTIREPRNKYVVYVMQPYSGGVGLGSMGSFTIFDITFKTKSSAEKLEKELKILFK